MVEFTAWRKQWTISFGTSHAFCKMSSLWHGTYVGHVLINQTLIERNFFPQGFALASRMLQKQDREKPAGNTAETPCSSSKTSGGFYSK